MNGDLKMTFIQKVLSEYGRESEAAMRNAARGMKIGVTGEGMQSIAYEAIQQGSGGTMRLSFKEYLRMVDMGAGRSHPLGGLSSMAATLEASNKTGLVQVKDKTRKPKKFYSKVVYGKLGWMYNKLLYGYTEETVAMLKKEIEEKSLNG